MHLQEDYVEYSRTGNVIKGQERAQIKSRYEEDLLINNHTVSRTSAEYFYPFLFLHMAPTDISF